MSPLQILEARAPKYEGLPRMADLLALAEAQTGTIYGTNRNLAVALLILHWLAKEDSGSAPGAVTSESEGGVSRAYSTPTPSPGQDGDLSSTSWGMEILGLRRKMAGPSILNRRFPQ